MVDSSYLGAYCREFPRRKFAIDVLFFGACLGLVKLFTKGRNLTISKWIIVSAALYFVLHEYILRSMTMDVSPYNIEVRSTSGCLSPTGRMRMNWMIGASYVVQTINSLFGTYSATVNITNAFMMSLTNRVVYRTSVRGTLPNKFIIISQHIQHNLDMLSTMTFVPPGYKIRTLNDFTGGGAISDTTDRILQRIFCKPLYGSSKLTRRDNKLMKQELNDFACEMKEEGEPTVYMIWASGRGWDNSLTHGVKEFKSGVFYMSCFSGLPICLVHTRLSSDYQQMICEQSSLIPPPEIPNRGHFPDYQQFYDHHMNSDTVERFRNRMYDLYCGLDRKITRDFGP